jgi:hypothetical protein
MQKFCISTTENRGAGKRYGDYLLRGGKTQKHTPYEHVGVSDAVQYLCFIRFRG